jgi:hypothetical protein
LQEQAAKREFIWPHLSMYQRASFLIHHCRTGGWLYVALTGLLHVAAVSYMLAASLVLGRLAARHMMPRVSISGQP